MGTGIGVGVLEAKTCDRCTFGGGITVQALRVVDADGSVSDIARVKDVDGVTA